MLAIEKVKLSVPLKGSKKGSVISVKRGFARWLVQKNYAVFTLSLKGKRGAKEQYEKVEKRKKSEDLSFSAKLQPLLENGILFSIPSQQIVQSEEGEKLRFGSVRKENVISFLKTKFSFLTSERLSLIGFHPIRRLGKFRVNLRIHGKKGYSFDLRIERLKKIEP